MRNRSRFLSALVLLFPATALAGSGTTKSYQPAWKNTAGAELALVSGTWADDGIGIGGYYDFVVQKNAGPGHVTVGLEGLYASTQSDFGPGACRRAESITTLGVRGRYFFDIHPVIRPWAGAGVGAYSVNRRYRDCATAVDDDFTIGIPLAVGLDLTFDALTVSLSLNVHESAPEDFQHVGVGLGWRF